MNANPQTGNGLGTAFCIAIVLFSSCFLSFAATTGDTWFVHKDEALRVADFWIGQNIAFRKAARTLPQQERFRITEISPVRLSPDGAIVAYHVALLPVGYLVVSADRRLTPIRCFSTSSDLVLDDVPGNALRAMLMSDMAVSADVLQKLNRSPLAQAEMARNPLFGANIERWDFLSAPPAGYSPADTATLSTLVGPLLETSWSQWRHFNAECPDDPHPGYGYDGKAPAGCVSVAGAQLTRFYSWPPYGRTGHVDVDDNSANLISGVFESDFRTDFHWTNMLAVYDPHSDEPSNAVSAVSQLIYGLGVAVNTDYGSYTSQGSVAIMDDLGSALNRHFHYESGSSISRSEDEQAFDNTLRDEILAHRPVVAAIPGHAMLVDGYMEDAGIEHFHINFGWGGQNDGWYHLSDINGDSLEDAAIGLVPQPVPLLDRSPDLTNVSGQIEFSWRFPDYQLPLVTEYRLTEGLLQSTNVIDSADNLTSWTGDMPPWTIAADGYAGNCFRKTGQQGRYRLEFRSFVKPGDDALLEFDYRISLIDDHFYVKTSIDGGYSWTVEEHFTDTGWDPSWHRASVDLSAYSGCETLIRFEYVLDSGHYWPSGGVSLDNIGISDIEVAVWNVVKDSIPPDTTDAALVRLDGCYYFSLEAFNGSEPLASSPFDKVIVSLAPELDVDGDGMANGWELQHFGSPTGAVAQADADQDEFSNLAEFLAGTDPYSDTSFLALSAVENDPAGIAVSWLSVSNRIYALSFSTNLAGGEDSFAPVASPLPATPPINTFVDESAAGLPMGFYRIEVVTNP